MQGLTSVSVASSTHRSLRRAVLTAAVGGTMAALLASSSSAAVRTYVADTNGNWTDGSKWDGGTPPVANDFLKFNGTAGGTITANNDFAANTQFGSGTTRTGAGTTASPFVGTINGNALEFNGPGQFTLTGNPINLAGNIVNTSGLLQTINIGFNQTGLMSPPFGYRSEAGTGGLAYGGAIGTGNGNDFTVAGAGPTTFNGLTRFAAFFTDTGSNLIVNANSNVAFFATINGATVVNSGATLLINSDVRVNGNLTVNNGGIFRTNQFFASAGAGVNATYTVNGNGQLRAATDFNIADGGGSVVTLNVNDTGVVAAGTLFVGRNGAGTLNMTGGTATLGGFRVGGEVPGVGVANLSGTSALTTTAFVSIGAAGAGTLNMSGNSTFTTTQDFNISDVGNANGILRIADNAIIKAGRLFVGKGNNDVSGIATTVVTGTTTQVNSKLSGIIVQTGGQYIQNGGGGDYRIAGSANDGTQANQNNVVGVWDMTGGTLAETANFQIGAQGAGRLSVAGTAVANSNGGFPSVGRYATGFGLVDIKDGGTFNQNGTGNRFIVAEDGSGVLNVRSGGTLNVNNTINANSATLTTALNALTIGNNNSANAIGIVNLMTGGTINTRSVGSVGGASSSTLNFEGGTLRYNGTADTATLINNLNNTFIYASGAIIDSNGFNVTVPQALRTAAGTGVQSISGTGAGYKTAPIVRITGGGGVGATAIANIDASGNLTGIVITAPGTGYTSIPTVTIYSANGGALAGALAINTGTNANTGGLTKKGVGRLTLSNVNTYGGVTDIQLGSLALAATGSIDNSTRINVGAGTTFDVSAKVAGYTYGGQITGTGTVAGSLIASGNVAPGNSIGDIGFGNLALLGTITAEYDGSDADTLLVSGTLDITAGSLNFVQLGAPFVSPAIIATYGTLVGTTFASVTLPAGTFVDYNFGGTNNTIAVVPEPATLSALAGVALMGLARRRRA